MGKQTEGNVSACSHRVAAKRQALRAARMRLAAAARHCQHYSGTADHQPSASTNHGRPSATQHNISHTTQHRPAPTTTEHQSSTVEPTVEIWRASRCLASDSRSSSPSIKKSKGRAGSASGAECEVCGSQPRCAGVGWCAAARAMVARRCPAVQRVVGAASAMVASRSSSSCICTATRAAATARRRLSSSYRPGKHGNPAVQL